MIHNAYGQGLHRFHPGLWDLAKATGFTPRLCRPYRAQTKGKVERFIGYLRRSFYVPLAAQLKQAGLSVDVDTANLEVRRWLREVANARCHQGTKAIPAERWRTEVATLRPAPAPVDGPLMQVMEAPAVPRPIVHRPESLQHPLSVYDALLAEARP